MQAAARQLARSECGRDAMERLLVLMDDECIDLTLLNQRAFLALLGAAWTDRAPEACAIMREALKQSGAPVTRR